MPIVSNWGTSNCISSHGWRWTLAFWPLFWPVASSLFDLKYWGQTWLVMWSVSSLARYRFFSQTAFGILLCSVCNQFGEASVKCCIASLFQTPIISLWLDQLLFVSPANCHQPESRAVGHPWNPCNPCMTQLGQNGAQTTCRLEGLPACFSLNEHAGMIVLKQSLISALPSPSWVVQKLSWCPLAHGKQTTTEEKEIDWGSSWVVQGKA